MKKTFLILSIAAALFSCNSKTSSKSTDVEQTDEVAAVVEEVSEPSLVGTEWVYTSSKGSSTVIFEESTFKVISDFNNVIEETPGTYSYEHPNITLEFGDFTQEMYIESNDTIKMPDGRTVSILVRKK